MHKVKVGHLINSDLRPYRLPFLHRLVQQRNDIDLTLYAGQALPGFGAPLEPPRNVPVRVKRVVNRFWPAGRHRVAWQSGALSILTSDADVIMCDDVAHNLTVWAIRLLHRPFGKKLVLIGFLTRERKRGPVSFARRAALRWLRRSADAVISYTESGRRALDSEGWPLERVFVAYNTVDTEMIAGFASDVTPEELSHLRLRLGVQSRKVILFLGKLIPEKHVEVAIRALDFIPDPPVLVIVGDGSERKRLESMSSAATVVFAGAIYDERELARYLAVSEFLVLPGRVGLTCVHGFAAERPCVTTESEGVSQTPEFDYVIDGHNALIVPDLDPEHHANAIARLLDDADLLERLRAGAKHTATSLRMDIMVDAYADAFQYAVRSRVASS